MVRRGRRAVALDAQARSGRCDPDLCVLGWQAHRHCACGMPIRVDGASVCELCDLEGLDPFEAALSDKLAEPEEWDGVSYPSRRTNRVGGHGVEPVVQLLTVVLRIEDEEDGHPRSAGHYAGRRPRVREVMAG